MLSGDLVYLSKEEREGWPYRGERILESCLIDHLSVHVYAIKRKEFFASPKNYKKKEREKKDTEANWVAADEEALPVDDTDEVPAVRLKRMDETLRLRFAVLHRPHEQHFAREVAPARQVCERGTNRRNPRSIGRWTWVVEEEEEEEQEEERRKGGKAVIEQEEIRFEAVAVLGHQTEHKINGQQTRKKRREEMAYLNRRGSYQRLRDGSSKLSMRIHAQNVYPLNGSSIGGPARPFSTP